MKAVFPFFLLLIFPLASSLALTQAGPWVLLAIVLAFVIMPLVDLALDTASRPSANKIELNNKGETLANILIHGYVVVQSVILAFAVVLFPEFLERNGFFESLCLVISIGIMTGGIGITVAHELVHRRESGSFWSGVFLLSSVLYGHFAVEHVLGHHSHVGTRKDPATARRGESVWFFTVRSIVMGAVSASSIERLRLSRLGKSWWSLENRLLISSLISFALLVAAWLVSGWPGLVFFCAQALVAVLLLELINYVEHYGLERKILENGKPEPVQLWHSWDSHSRLSGWILIHLSRHADHHKYPARPFTKLEGSGSSPLLPASYPACVLLATLPPLWYRVMNPRLDRFEGSRK